MKMEKLFTGLLALLLGAPASATLYLVEASGPSCHSSLTCPDSTLSFNYDDVTGQFSNVAWDMRNYHSGGYYFQDVKDAATPFQTLVMNPLANDGVLLESIEGTSLRFDYAFYSAAGQSYAGLGSGASPAQPSYWYQTGAPVLPWAAALDWDPAATLDDGVGPLAFFVRWNDGVGGGAGTYFGIGGATATRVPQQSSDQPNGLSAPPGVALLLTGAALVAGARAGRTGKQV